jgi:hypothetical protein
MMIKLIFVLMLSQLFRSSIFKSTDAGNTYNMVDTGGTDWGPKFYYDSDANHIYRTFVSNYPNRSLKVSAQQGNAFTWQILMKQITIF